MRRMTCAIALAVSLAVPVSVSAEETAALRQTATLDINQTRVGFILSANAGGGVLHYQGTDIPFSIGGLGVGGIGVAKLKASGEVYNLYDRSKFEGAYSQLRSGITVGNHGTGSLWLRNAQGVVLELKGASKGIALSLGADVVNVSFK